MAKRVPLGAIGVTREVRGKKTTVYPTIGEPFDFTDDELKSINAMAKASGNELVRKLVVEGGATQADVEPKTVDDMTVPQLRDYAASKQIDLGDATKKDDVIARIKAVEDEDL